MPRNVQQIPDSLDEYYVCDIDGTYGTDNDTSFRVKIKPLSHGEFQAAVTDSMAVTRGRLSGKDLDVKTDDVITGLIADYVTEVKPGDYNVLDPKSGAVLFAPKNGRELLQVLNELARVSPIEAIRVKQDLSAALYDFSKLQRGLESFLRSRSDST
jgi:hypothetical protein